MRPFVLLISLALLDGCAGEPISTSAASGVRSPAASMASPATSASPPGTVVPQLTPNATPPPSIDGMVTVGGLQIAVSCGGVAGPTVVFESAIGGDHSLWPIADQIRQHAHVCVYDRPGDGASDLPAQPRTASSDVAGLHELLGAVPLSGPIVLIGHSYGGLVAYLAAREYPEDVAGLVLIDASHPRQFERFRAVMTDAEWQRLDAEFANFPYVDFSASLEEGIDGFGTLGDLPLTVISATLGFSGTNCLPGEPCAEMQEIWLDLQDDYASLSTDVVHVEVDAGHYIHDEQPDVVVTEILGMLARVAATAGPRIPLHQVSTRAAHTATTLADGSIFVAGGCTIDGCGSATADTFLVSAEATHATQGPRLAQARDSHTATLVGDSVVFAGGFDGEGQPPLDSVEIFRAGTAFIEVSPPLSRGRGGHAAAALGDGRVLVVGGWVGPRTYTASSEIVDPAIGEVVPTSDLPYGADALDAVTLADGKVLVTGGQVQPGVGTEAAAIYDGATGSWVSVGPMQSRRFKHTSVLLEDGRVLVIGGTTDDQQLLATTELFDPVSQTFTAGPELHEPRYKMSGGAVVVDGQRVLISGGGRTVELLDLDAGTSRAIDTFVGRGSFATINALGDSWLVLGGYDDQITLRRQFVVIRADDLEAAGV